MNHPFWQWIDGLFFQSNIGQQFLVWQLQGLVLGLVGLLLLRVFSATAASRHHIVSALFSALLVLPALAVIGPVFTIEIPVTVNHAESLAAAHPSAQLASQSAMQSALNEAGSIFHTGFNLLVNAPIELLLISGLFIYVFGVLYLVTRLGLANLVMLCLHRRSERCTEIQWLTALVSAKNTMSVTRKAELRYSPHIKSPMTWGMITPIIFLPISAKNWQGSLIEHTLLHELAHISRNDWLNQQVITIACALYWINPLCWIIAHQLHDDAETACDDKVLATGIDNKCYAQDLVYVAQQVRSMMCAAVNAMAINRRPNQLSLRIRSILLFSAWVDLSPRQARSLAAIILALLLPVLSIKITLIEVPAFVKVYYSFDSRGHLVMGDYSDGNTSADSLPATDGDNRTMVFSSESDRTNYRDTLSALNNHFDRDAFKRVAIRDVHPEPLNTHFSLATTYIPLELPPVILNPELQIVERGLVNNTTQKKSDDVTHTTLQTTTNFAAGTLSETEPQFESEVESETPKLSEAKNATEQFASKRVVLPRYPRAALSRGIEGEVIVTFFIDHTGKVINPQVIHAHPQGVFDRSVLRAVKQFEFEPSGINPHHTDLSQAQETFKFVLES